MKIEMPKQTLHFEADIKKDYAVCWHTDEKGNKVNDLTVTPVKGTVDISCDIIIDTDDLKVTDILQVMKDYAHLQKAIRKHSSKMWHMVPAGEA